MLPFVLWMITCTSLFGCVLAPFSRPGEIHVRFGEAAWATRACLFALAARGTLMASIATSAVIAPRPPLPQRALDRDSPPRLPVPHSALDRVSPRLPPFVRTLCFSFPRPRAGRMSPVSGGQLHRCSPEIRAEPTVGAQPQHPPAG